MASKSKPYSSILHTETRQKDSLLFCWHLVQRGHRTAVAGSSVGILIVLICRVNSPDLANLFAVWILVRSGLDQTYLRQQKPARQKKKDTRF